MFPHSYHQEAIVLDDLDRRLNRIADLVALIVGLLATLNTVYGLVLGRGPGDTALIAGSTGLIVAALIVFAAHWIFGALPHIHKAE